ncbi:MAG: WhiB family transcriptional regulator [Chloroflexi bacterium]|nr:WhiB family transcriptional regulator [Chloroflexota bacterium]
MTWKDDAACRDRPDVEWFAPACETGGAPTGPRWDPGPALAVCAQCPSIQPCRRWAESVGDIVDGAALHGVVGGVAPNPRKASGVKPGSAKPPRVEPNHGTDAGYKQHKRLGEDACMHCRRAHSRYNQDEYGKTG